MLGTPDGPQITGFGACNRAVFSAGFAFPSSPTLRDAQNSLVRIVSFQPQRLKAAPAFIGAGCTWLQSGCVSGGVIPSDADRFCIQFALSDQPGNDP